MKALASLNKYFFKYKWRLLSGTLFVIVSNAFAIFPAELFRKGIDTVVEALSSPDNTAEFEDEIYSALMMYALLILGAALLKGVFMFFMRQTIIVMSRLIEFDMKNEIYKHYQELDLAFYKRNKIGDLMNRISEDVSQVRMYTGPAIMYSISTVTLFIMILVQMLMINAELTAYVLIPLPFLVLAIYLINSRVISLSEKVQSQLSKITSMVQEHFSGLRIVRGYNRTNAENERFSIESDEYKERNLNLVRINALFGPAMVFLIGVSTIITIYIGGIKVFNNEITTGVIAEFIIYVSMLTWPVASLGWVISLMQRAAASQIRINEFLNIKSEIQQTENPVELTFKGSINFQNIGFTYPDSGTLALKELSFTLSQGKSLGIIGKTGSGKTSIAQLILRLYDPDSGVVTADGINLKDINLQHYRKQIAYVPQDVFLFSDTILNNIAFGLQMSNTDELRERIIEAAKWADIHDTIVDFPQGYDTVLGERGINLSGGQKQRIAIARALIRKPSLLILDDCLSAVDTVTEEKILSNLKNIITDQSTLIISHRISSVMLCNEIVVLSNGTISEKGAHNELIDKNGYYAKIFSQQNLEKLSA